MQLQPVDGPLKKFDDLTVLSGDLARQSEFTLTGLIRNEMHFLPAFLPYYRALGVDRFVFIDDQSDDGSRAFLAAQDDVIVLQSERRFGELVSEDDAQLLSMKSRRRELIWRMLLLQKFCLNNWSLHLDLDEFLTLPTGMTVPSFARMLDAEGCDTVWSVMLDMYPESIQSLTAMELNDVIDIGHGWFFDGRAHLRLNGDKEPRTVYSGSRGRLLFNYDLNKKADWFHRNVFKHFGISPPRYNAIRKPVLHRWREGATLLSAHSTTLKASKKYLLPLRHYKFNGATSARIKDAVARGMHSNGASEYADLARLLGRMSNEDADFICNSSLPYRSFDDLLRSGVVQGF
jgi:hypothetical protein